MARMWGAKLSRLHKVKQLPLAAAGLRPGFFFGKTRSGEVFSRVKSCVCSPFLGDLKLETANQIGKIFKQNADVSQYPTAEHVSFLTKWLLL